MVPSARRGDLTVDDLPLPDRQQAEPAYEELNQKWEEAVQVAGKGGKQPRLLKVRGWEGGGRGGAAAPTPKPLLHSRAGRRAASVHHCSLLPICALSLSPAHSTPAGLPPQVLWKTYGRDLMIAGVFKLLWSVFVIMGGERAVVRGRRSVRSPLPHLPHCTTAPASHPARLPAGHCTSLPEA